MDLDVIRDCVKDEDGNPVPIGWERLKVHAADAFIE